MKKTMIFGCSSLLLLVGLISCDRSSDHRPPSRRMSHGQILKKGQKAPVGQEVGKRGSEVPENQNPFPSTDFQQRLRASPGSKVSMPRETELNGQVKDLQILLKDMSNIYLNAWMSVTKDKTSRPRNFFEVLASKLEDSTIDTLIRGEKNNPILDTNCRDSKIVRGLTNGSSKQILSLYDCATKNFSVLLKFKPETTHWEISTNQMAFEQLLPGQMGFLATISMKPSCQFEIKRDGDSPKIVKAQCSEWGQQQSSSDKTPPKSLLMTSIVYDTTAENILVTKAQYIDYDSNNQICRSGVLKREAPAHSNSIYQTDEGADYCEETSPQEAPNLKSDPGKAAPPKTREPVVNSPPASPHSSEKALPDPYAQDGNANFRTTLIGGQNPAVPTSSDLLNLETPDSIGFENAGITSGANDHPTDLPTIPSAVFQNPPTADKIPPSDDGSVEATTTDAANDSAASDQSIIDDGDAE